MEQTEELLEKIKANNSQLNRDILKDIIAIDGAIVEEDSLNYKEKIYKSIEDRYSKELEQMKYHLYQEELNEKIDEYVENNKKDINTNMGLLKLFLIRIAAIKDISNNKTKEILNSISNSNKFDEIKQLYENLDEQLLKNL